MRKMKSSSQVVLSLVLFPFLLTAVNGSSCTICRGDFNEQYKDRVIHAEMGWTCDEYDAWALGRDDKDVTCESFFQVIGSQLCGCEMPEDEEPPKEEEICELCPNRVLLGDNQITLHNYSPYITCTQVADYLSNYKVTDDACHIFKVQGEQECCGTDVTSPPTYEDERKVDCDLIAQGDFTEVARNTDYSESTLISFDMKMELADGVTIEEVGGPLQEEMKTIVTLDLNPHCSADMARRLSERTLFKYVDFTSLKDLGNGILSGIAEVHYTLLPSDGRRKLDESNFSDVVVKSINDNASVIASRVNGVEGLEAVREDDGEHDEDNDGLGVAIGVGVASTLIIVVAGLLVSKKKGSKQDPPRDLDRVEFLPSIQPRSDQDYTYSGENNQVRFVKVNSNQTAVEVYPEEISNDGSESTGQQDVLIVESNAVEFEVAPYGINSAFPIKTAQNNDPFQDSESSDEEFPCDEEDIQVPIQFRKKPSYNVRATMDL